MSFALAAAAGALCADFSFTGTLGEDAGRRQFTFTLAQPTQVIIRTWSYAGGSNAAGTKIARGGFDPTLSLFDPAGNLFAVNRDGGCDNVPPDQVTGRCWDSLIQTKLTPGTWQVVLTQSENLPDGPTLSDPFVYDGAGNFTAAPGDAQPGFWDFYPDKRGEAWAVDFLGVDKATLTPDSPLDPNGAAIVNSGSLLGGGAGPNTALTLFDPMLNGDSSITVTVDGIPAQVLFSGGSQLNFVIPPGVKPKAGAVIEVRRGGVLLLSGNIDVVDASPALFTLSQTGKGQAAVLNVLPEGGVVLNGNTPPSKAAKRGTFVAIYGTGFGDTTAGADGLARLNLPVSATVGGVHAIVAYAGLVQGATSGLQQFNVLIPNDAPAGPAVPILLTVGSHMSQTGTTIAIE